MADISSKSLEYMIHHVVLPPQLPNNGDDGDFQAEDIVLLRELSSALDTFAALYSCEGKEGIRSVSAMIKKAHLILEHDGGIDEKSLMETFKDISSKGMSQLLGVCSLSLAD
jgi:hypothetical protein